MMKPLPIIEQLRSLSFRGIFFALLICLCYFGLVMTQKDALIEHKLYFTEDRKEISFQFSEMSEKWTIKMLRDRFPGHTLNCQPNPGEMLGDMGCVLDAKSFNGVPALFISFFFSSNHLQQIAVNIPWWKHQVAYEYLQTTMGKPAASQLFPHSGVRLHGWILTDGTAVFYNRDKSINPLRWNTIYWQSASLCAANRCISMPKN